MFFFPPFVFARMNAEGFHFTSRTQSSGTRPSTQAVQREPWPLSACGAQNLRERSLLRVHNYTQNDPENHEIIRGWRQVVDEFDDRVMFGEIYAPLNDLMKYYGAPKKVL